MNRNEQKRKIVKNLYLNKWNTEVPSSEKGLLYKTREKKNTFAKGSIGYANNMNDVTAPIDSFKAIENILNLRKPKENEQQEEAV